MLDLLKDNSFIVLYAITWLISIIKLPKYYDSTLKYFPIIIGYTMFTEILGAFIYVSTDFTLFSEEKFNSHTILLYNIYDLFFFSYFFYIYFRYLTNTQLKIFVKYGAITFILSYIVNILIVDSRIYELWYAYTVGSTILILACLAYICSLWFKPEQTSISKNLLFWISLGLLIFHLGYAPITIFKNINLEISTKEHVYLRKIHIGLITIMYSSFIIGFLKTKRFKL